MEYANLSEEVLVLAEARGAQSARLVKNYRAARSSAHRHKIGEALMQNASPDMWLALIESQPRTQRKISLSDAEYAEILARYGIAANQSESNALRQALGLPRLAHGGARPGAGRPEQAK